MTQEQILAELYRLQDTAYADFQAKLIPNLPREAFIGVRTPDLRKLAKRLAKEDCGVFLADLPHPTFDENQLHAFLLAEEKDFDACLRQVEAFLLFVDNWATCDQLSPKVFRKEPERLLPAIEGWLASGRTYTVRFGMGMLMQHFLDERFEARFPAMVAAVQSEEYYINMMIAWYFATALAKQWDAVLPYLTERRLPEWVHRKTIQKAVESYRIPEERKAFLKGLRER